MAGESNPNGQFDKTPSPVVPRKKPFGAWFIGLAMAVGLSAVLYQLPSEYGVDFLAVFLGATASVYVGSALHSGSRRLVVLETLLFTVLLVCALVGLWISTVFMALGYFIHGVWDALHHPHRVGAAAGRRFPPMCLTLDGAVGVFILAVY